MPIQRALSRAVALGSFAAFSIVFSAGTSLAEESAPPPQAVTIGVDHVDPANQQPEKGRVFEYTDFFSRNVSIHSGDTIDFQVAPGGFHVITLAKSEDVARSVYPVGYTDKDDPKGPNGARKIVNGPGQFAITGGSTQGGGTIVTDPTAPLNLVAGDKVAYKWTDPHNVHSVVFPAPPPGQNDLVPPMVFDCGTTFSATPSPSCTEPGETWENRGGIFDPGNAPSRTA